MTDPTPTEELRTAVQEVVRSMGLLQVRRTPCGQAMSVAQAHTLMFLLGQPEDATPPTQQVIAAHLKLDKSSVTRLIQKMGQMGMIRIEICSTDRRARRVHLTDQGRQMARQVDEASRDLFTQVLGHLPEGVSGDVTDSLRQLAQAIQQLETGRTP